MTKNTAPVLLVSKLPANMVDFSPRLPRIVCPGCGSWVTVSGNHLPVHRGDNRPDAPRDHTGPRRPRCIASGREVRVDTTAAEVGARLFRDMEDGRNRHRTRTAHPMAPAPLPPVHRMAMAR